MGDDVGGNVPFTQIAPQSQFTHQIGLVLAGDGDATYSLVEEVVIAIAGIYQQVNLLRLEYRYGQTGLRGITVKWWSRSLAFEDATANPE